MERSQVMWFLTLAFLLVSFFTIAFAFGVKETREVLIITTSLIIGTIYYSLLDLTNEVLNEEEKEVRK